MLHQACCVIYRIFFHISWCRISVPPLCHSSLSLILSCQNYNIQETLFNNVDALYENYQDLPSSTEQLQALVDRLAGIQNSLENQSRRNNLIFGLPLDSSETWKDCKFKVRDILRHSMKIKKEVKHAHPLKGNNPLLSVREDVSELSLSLTLSLSLSRTHTHTPKVLAFCQKLVIQLTLNDRIL